MDVLGVSLPKPEFRLHPTLPLIPVGSGAGARSRRSGVTGLHPFGCEVGSYSVRSSRFQLPPPQTRRAVFRHRAYLNALQQGLCDPLAWQCFLSWLIGFDSIVIEEAKRLMYPLRTPPVPAKAFPLSDTRHVPPSPFLNPVANELKTPTCVPQPKVVYPSPKYRIDELNDTGDRL